MKKPISTPWIIVLVFLTLTAGMIGCPTYYVFYAGMKGRSELNRATYNRMILVQESKAKEEASWHLGASDTVRAHCIARSNEIIGQSLNHNESYLRWLWIDELSKQQNVIYVATESGMPILEAGRLGQIQSKKDSLGTGKKHSD